MFKKDSCDVLRALFHQFGVVDVDTQGKEKTGVSPVNELVRAVLRAEGEEREREGLGGVEPRTDGGRGGGAGRNTSTKLANFASLVVTARCT